MKGLAGCLLAFLTGLAAGALLITVLSSFG